MSVQELNLLRPIVFAPPEHLSDITSWHPHMPFAFWCTDALKPRVFVELGTHKGDSYFAFCQAAARSGLPIACYAIDTWKGDEHAGLYEGSVWEDVYRHNERHYSRFSRLVRSTFEEAKAYFPDHSVDLLHIDGLHTYEAVKADFESWLPKLSDRAVVLMHDCNVRELGFGVWRLWEELRLQYPHFAFLHGHGLGMLAVGKNAPEPIERLCHLDPDDQEHVRAFFSRLGDAVLATSGLAISERRSASLQAELGQRRTQIHALERTVNDLTVQVAELAEVRAALESSRRELARKTAESAKAAAEASRLQGLAEAQAQDTAEKARLVERLLQGGSEGRPTRAGRLIAKAGRSAALLPLKLVFWFLTGQLRSQRQRLRMVREIRESGLFDLVHYLQKHTHLAPNSFAAISDFLTPGVVRDPNPWFDGSWYLEQNPDVAAAGINPLLHFIRIGWKEGRNPHPWFDLADYVRRYPDVVKEGINPLLHFLRYGLPEGRKPHRDLDPGAIQSISLGLAPSPKALDSTAPDAPADPSDDGDPYARWVRLHGAPRFSERKLISEDISRMKLKPLISIIMPAYESEEKWLRRAVESVRGQLYPHWQLCIADDASPSPRMRPLLEELQKLDSRIRVIFRQENGGISAASNSAIDAAEGEFVAFLDHDDEISEAALYQVAAEINRHPQVDFLYSDQDKIDLDGRRFDPYFKPDFNPDLLRSQNYVDHLAVFRTSLVRTLGKLRSAFDGSQDYDLVLRTVEASTPDRIRHIPHVLYHWRAVPGSIAADVNAKSSAAERSRDALREHLARVGVNAQVTSDFPQYSLHRVVYPLPEPAPLVTVIIPTRDKLDLLEPCVEDVLSRTDYPSLELIIVDNNSTEKATVRYLNRIARDPRVRVLEYKGAFDYSAINNFAAAQAKGSVLALLNNDIRVIRRDWLREMVAHASRPEIGAVGARLYYPNDTVQHAGVFLGPRGLAGHLFRYAPRESMAHWARAHLTQNLSAVTAACLVVRKQVFEEVSGFSSDFTVTFNDVDLCLRILERGYRNLYAPHAELYHLESMTRGRLAHGHEEELFGKRWAKLIAADPAYNPNLTIEGEDLSPAFPPRVRQPWREPLVVKATGETQPLASLITRTHGDREQYLLEAIESVCRQTYRPLELLVVEDGPTRAREIIKTVEVPPGVSIRNIPLAKVGRCRAGNTGLEAARGKYAGFLDDDDLLLPGHVETLVALLEKKPEIAAAYANAWEVPTRTLSLRPLVYEETSAELFQGHSFSLGALWNYNYVTIQSVLFRHSLFERLGGLEEQLDCLEDWDLWLRYSAEMDFAYADRPTSIFRMPASKEVLDARRAAHLGYLPIVRQRQRALYHRYQGTPFQNRLQAAAAQVLQEAGLGQPPSSMGPMEMTPGESVGANRRR